MKRLKGPELKMPEVRMPDFLADLFYDLRDRRLLPLVVLVLVAIVAAPFLLSGGSEEAALPSTAAVGPGTGESATEAAQLTVVEAKPGLRDYRKRLKERTPTDPFLQRYSGPVSGGGQLSDEASTTEALPASGGEPTTTTSPPTPSEGSPPSSPPASGGGGDDNGGGGASGPRLTLFTFAIDVKISRTETKKDGSVEMGKPETRERVLPTTPLPGEKAPVVTYMGVAKGAKKALLMVSNNVKSIFGDAKCLSGTDTCQLLEVEPGFPESFVYGDNEVRYKVNVLKIEPVISGHT
jgi:hypothetical protein